MKTLSCALIFIASCTVFAQQQKGINSTKAFKLQEAARRQNDYKVYKIDSLNNLYLIYATRNDSIFKIVSLKQKGVKCIVIKANNFYAFKLQSRFGVKFLGKYDMSPKYSDNTNAYNYYGTFVPLEKELRINDLYTDNRLKGLCFSE